MTNGSVTDRSLTAHRAAATGDRLSFFVSRDRTILAEHFCNIHATLTCYFYNRSSERTEGEKIRLLM